MIALFNYLGLIGAFLSVSLVLPAFVAFGTDDLQNGLTLLVYAGIGGFFSIAILMATHGRNASLDRTSSIYLAIVSWFVFPLILAVPISDLFAISYGDAVFEAVSAFTTTAADGIANIDALPASAIFLRASLQWTGGLATLLTFILFLGPIRAGGLPKPRASAGEATGRTTASINRIAMSMLRFFLFVTLLCFVLLMMSGIDAFPSLILATTAVTAGGYLPDGRTLSETASPLGLMVISVFFLLASTNVFWQRMVMRWQVPNLKAHRESYFVILAILLLSLVFLVTIIQASGPGSAGVVASEAIFNASSLVSTSGLQTRPGIFLLIGPLAALTVLLIGGGCFSMAGGIKYYRIGAMGFHAEAELSRLVYPHIATSGHFGSEEYSLPLMKAIWTMFAAFLFVLIIGAGALAASGLSFQASFTASVAAITNAGPAYSVDWVPRGTEGWLSYPDMSVTQKLVLSCVMLFGRLEVIAVFVALNPFHWLRQ